MFPYVQELITDNEMNRLKLVVLLLKRRVLVWCPENELSWKILSNLNTYIRFPLNYKA